MIRALAACAFLAAAPAAADDALAEFLGPHGCTLGPGSRQAALDAQFAPDRIDGAFSAWRAADQATDHGAYTVLSEEACKIRLPVVLAPVPLSQLEPMISVRDAFEDDPGCYLEGDEAFFDEMNGGARGAGRLDHIDFLAANIIKGHLRFHGPDPLQVPRGMQVMVGDCAEVPNRADIEASHTDFEVRYAAYIRASHEALDCDGTIRGLSPAMIAAQLQGMGPDLPKDRQPPVNAWAFLEFELIAMAAGFYEGIGPTSRGTPRPPLCHVAR